MDEFWNSIKDWLTTSGLTILVIVIVTWIALHFGMKVVKRVIRKTVDTDQDTEDSRRNEELRYKTLVRIIGSLYRTLVLFIAILMILSEFNVNLAPLFASAGIISLAVGFGAQDLVKDIVAGVFILAENQYRVGDVVELEGFSGTVEKMTLRVTVIRSLDGNVHYIPNGSIKQATNKTMEYSKVNIDLPVHFDTNIDKAKEGIDKIGKEMAKEKEWRNDIVEPPRFLRVNDITDKNVVIKIVGKTKPNKQWAISGELRRRILDAIQDEKEAVEKPVDQIVVHKGKDSKSS